MAALLGLLGPIAAGASSPALATGSGSGAVLHATVVAAAGAAADGADTHGDAPVPAEPWAPAQPAAAAPTPVASAPPSGEPEAETKGYRWRGPPAAAPDCSGAARDAAYFLGYQAVGVAVLYLMPSSVSGWGDQDKGDADGSKWHENVTNPVVWDGDKWFINYVLHPYWGAAYYTRARERGLGGGASFWYSALMSALWEYGAEAIAEPVSIEDLIVTPVFGTLLGEYVFEPWRQRIRGKPEGLDAWDRAILAITDPLGAINATIDSWFGIRSTTQLQPFIGRVPALRGGPGRALDRGSVAPSSRGWGLQLTVRW